MEDSNLWYYIVLGVIYFLSKIFGKKKKPQPTEFVEENDTPEEYEQQPAKVPDKPPVTFEDIFKELTGGGAKSVKEALPKVESIAVEETTAEASPVLATELVDYQKTNIERVRPDEEIDIPGHKPIEHPSHEFKRSEKYAIREETNEIRNGVLELLDDHTGLQQALILKEILDRKY